MSGKHANARPSGERGGKIKDTAIYSLIFMLIASKYAMNVLVSSTQTVPDIKMPHWQYWGSSCEQHHTANTKSLLSKDNTTLQGSRGKKKTKTDSHCQVYKVLHIKVPSHWIPAVFWDTHQASLLALGMEFKQPYLIHKNQIVPKLTGHFFCSQHFIVWAWCKKQSRLIWGGQEADSIIKQKLTFCKLIFVPLFCRYWETEARWGCINVSPFITCRYRDMESPLWKREIAEMRTHDVTCQVICEQYNRVTQRRSCAGPCVCASDILYNTEMVLWSYIII